MRLDNMSTEQYRAYCKARHEYPGLDNETLAELVDDDANSDVPWAALDDVEEA